MGNRYQHLGAEERAVVMVMDRNGDSKAAIARLLNRSPSSVSRELSRNASPGVRYDAVRAGQRAHAERSKRRREPKLSGDTALFGAVCHSLREGWSPEQIAGALNRKHPADLERTVCHETIYNALYVMPRGDLRTELLACLRRGRCGRRPRSRGTDRRGQIPDMVSIHVRPPEVEDRLIPGHWEGDLLKGAANRSAVGTLVERSSRLVLVASMTGATASAAVAGFSRLFTAVPDPMKKTMTYDRGKEMSQHRLLTERTGVSVYFADPHSPWQRGSNENTNGLLRQYLPKGADLSIFSQDDLDAIAEKLNSRPRKIHGFRSPVEVYRDLLAQEHIRLNDLATSSALGT
jgi:transposase, IS30 family